MATLCFITTCMGRLAHLRQTLGRMVAQPEGACVVVDYSCPDRCGDWVTATRPGVRVVRETGQECFNQSRARNRGAAAAGAPWLCFCDADVLLDPAFAATVSPLLRPGHYYRPAPLTDYGLFGAVVCAREDFARVGGYDEVYQGWGDEDIDLYHALELGGVKPQTFPAALLRHLSHAEAERVRFHETKDRVAACSINRLYRTIKFDLARLTGRVPDRAYREDLYRRVAADVSAARQRGEWLNLEVAVATATEMPGGWTIGRTLTYQYGPG